MSDLNTDSNEDENSSRNFSPTPTPRRKLLIKVINKDSEDEKIFCIMPNPSDTENLILNDSTSMSTDNTNPCTNNSDTNATFLTNLTSTDLELDLEQPRKQSYMSSTMPTPRKPRKKFYNADTINPRIRANKEEHKNESNESSFDKNASLLETPNMNKTAPGYINDNFFAFNNYGNSSVITPALSLISSSSTPKFAFNQTEDYENNSSYETDYLISKMREEYAFDKFQIDTKSIQKLIEPSTLRIDRGNDLKRPTAPPPPLPKQPPPLFEKVNFIPIENHAFNSSTPYFFRNKTTETTVSSVQVHNETMPKSSFKSLKRNFSNEMRNSCKAQAPIGFERLAKANEAEKNENPITFQIKKVKALLESRQLSSSSSSFISKLKSKFLIQKKTIFKKSAFNFLLGFFVLALFTFCISCIIVFQTQVHQFYRRFLNTTQSNSSNHTEYFIAGSNLVNQTVLICNGPYFSYQVNNLFVLPFSLLLVVIFSFFSKRDSCCVKQGIFSCGSRPGLPSSINPFQRRNRFFVAALFCILANEIFKMIESSMFDTTSHTKSPFNTTTELINSVLAKNWNLNSSLIQDKFKQGSNTDFLRVGLGIEPFLLSKETTLATTTTPLITSNKPVFAFAPSIVTYSKPRLPPRLNFKDFLTTTTTTTTKSLELNDNLTVAIVDGVKIFRSSQNKTSNIVNSFNRSLDGSSSKTLYEVSMSLYQNEYVQGAMQRIFQTQSFKWTIIVAKLETFGFMMFEVLIIGMRYYPLLGVMDKNSIVCLMLASVYMWADTFYNVTITGLCEGLKLNVSFDLLKDIRRVFGVGFIMDVKEHMKMNKFGLFDEKDQVPVDTQLLFSTSRIVYSIVKSLPHFFCLSYVTIRLTAALFEAVYFKLRKVGVLSSSKKKKQKNEPKTYEYSNYVIDTNSLNANMNKKLNLIYTKMTAEDTYTNYSSLIIRNRLNNIEYLRKSKLSFEERYVKSLFKNSARVKPNEKGLKLYFFGWIFDENFRFSTRAVCTYTVCFTVLYYLTCFLMFYGSIFVDMIYLPSIYKQTIVLSTCVTSLICLVQLVLSIKQFKLHLKSLYKGTSDQYISPKSAFSNKKIATSSFNYSGYAVTYMCWGYIILFALLTVVSFQLIFFGGNSIGLFVLLVLLPFIVSILIVKFINKFIGSLAAKFCFLQSKSKVLALKNVKCYSIFLYFKFFYDCFTGFAYCMLRIMTSIVLSVVFLPRLDYSFMGRSLEGMDTAFMSYVGYLHWESHHTNPVVICFCDMLKRNLKINNKLKKYNIVQNKTRTRVRNRWYLLYLMSKNLQLVQYRRR